VACRGARPEPGTARWLACSGARSPVAGAAQRSARIAWEPTGNRAPLHGDPCPPRRILALAGTPDAAAWQGL